MKRISRLLGVFSLLISFFLFHCQKDITGPENNLSYDWEFSTPEAQGLDSQILAGAFIEAQNRGFVDCILIIKNGYLVAESYYNGYRKNSAHNSMSVAKSFLSAITGIALKEGCFDNLNNDMLSFFPEYIYPSIDERKYDITIRHLLMMRAGIDREQNNYFQIYNSSNWVQTTIQLPQLSDPGDEFRYNTFQTHLLSAIITRTCKTSTRDFAENFLFGPLGISVHQWEQDPQGYYFGGNSMYFTPGDMARLGYLYLNSGNLDGKQIIPSEWVEESLTNFTNWKGKTWGALQNYNYGYLWWLGEINAHEVFLAIGHGGQFIINFPELKMIIVTTADSKVDWDTADQQEQSILTIVAENILPAIFQ